MTIRRLTAKDYDEHMGKHFAVFEDGRMVAALGVYPLPAYATADVCVRMGNLPPLPLWTEREYHL